MWAPPCRLAPSAAWDLRPTIPVLACCRSTLALPGEWLLPVAFDRQRDASATRTPAPADRWRSRQSPALAGVRRHLGGLCRRLVLPAPVAGALPPSPPSYRRAPSGRSRETVSAYELACPVCRGERQRLAPARLFAFENAMYHECEGATHLWSAPHLSESAVHMQRRRSSGRTQRKSSRRHDLFCRPRIINVVGQPRAGVSLTDR